MQRAKLCQALSRQDRTCTVTLVNMVSQLCTMDIILKLITLTLMTDMVYAGSGTKAQNMQHTFGKKNPRENMQGKFLYAPHDQWRYKVIKGAYAQSVLSEEGYSNPVTRPDLFYKRYNKKPVFTPEGKMRTGLGIEAPGRAENLLLNTRTNEPVLKDDILGVMLTQQAQKQFKRAQSRSKISSPPTQRGKGARKRVYKKQLSPNMAKRSIRRNFGRIGRNDDLVNRRCGRNVRLGKRQVCKRSNVPDKVNRGKRAASAAEIQTVIAARIKATRGKQVLLKEGTKTLVTPLHVVKIYRQFDTVQFRLGSLSGADTFQSQKKERMIVRTLKLDLYAMLELRLLQDHDNLCKMRGLAVANLRDLKTINGLWWPDTCTAYALQNSVVKGGIDVSCLKTGGRMDLDLRNCYGILNKMSRTWGKVFYPSAEAMLEHVQSVSENVLHLSFNNSHLFFSGALYTCTACIGNLKPVSEQSVLVDGVKNSYNDVLQLAFMNLVWGSQIHFQQLVHVLDDVIVRQYNYEAHKPSILSVEQMGVYITRNFPALVPEVEQAITFNTSEEFTTLFKGIVNSSIDQKILFSIASKKFSQESDSVISQVYNELKKFNTLLIARLEHVSWIVANRKFSQGRPLLIMFREGERVHNFVAYTQSYFGKLRDSQLRAVLYIITDAKISFFQELVNILKWPLEVKWYQQLKPLYSPAKPKVWANATRKYTVASKTQDVAVGVNNNSVHQGVHLQDQPTSEEKVKDDTTQLNDQPQDPRFMVGLVNTTGVNNTILQLLEFENVQAPNVINLNSRDDLSMVSDLLIRKKRSWLSDLLGIATKEQLDSVQDDEFKLIEKESNLELAYKNVQTNTQLIHDRLTSFGDKLKTMQEDDILVLANISTVVGKQVQADKAISDLAASLTASIGMSRIYFQLLLEVQLLMSTVQQFQAVVDNILHKRFDFTLFNAGTVTQNLGAMAIDAMLAVEPHVYYSGEEYILKYSLPVLGDPIYQYMFQTLEAPVGQSGPNTKINIPSEVYLGKDFGEVSIQDPARFCTESTTNVFICDLQYAVKKQVNPCIRQVLLQHLYGANADYKDCVNYVIPTSNRPVQQYLVFPERGELSFVSALNTSGLFACKDGYRVNVPIVPGLQIFQLRNSMCTLKVGDSQTAIQLPAADTTEEVELVDITSQALDVVTELDEFVVEELGLNLSISDMQEILHSVNKTLKGEAQTLQDLAVTLEETKKELVPFNYNPIVINAKDFRGSRGGLVVVFWLIVGVVGIALLLVCTSCTRIGGCVSAFVLFPFKLIWIIVKFCFLKMVGRNSRSPFEQFQLLRRDTGRSMRSNSLRSKVKDASFWHVYNLSDIRVQVSPETTLFYDYSTRTLANGIGGLVLDNVQTPLQVQEQIDDMVGGGNHPSSNQPKPL